MPASEKKEIRRIVRSKFPGDVERRSESTAICRHVTAWEAYRNARVVGSYVPMVHEADVMPILQDVLASGKTLVLPRCGKKSEMFFHRVASMDELVPGAYGLPEPQENAPVVEKEEIDLLLVPLEALTREGLRLGKGGGYYDNCLSGYSGMSLGVALQHQWVDALPADKWDVPLDAAVDSQAIHMFIGTPERIV